VPAPLIAAGAKKAAAGVAKQTAKRAGQAAAQRGARHLRGGDDDEEEGPNKALLVLAAVVAGPPVAVLVVVVLFAFGLGTTPSAAGTCPPGVAVPSSVELNASTIDGINALKPMYEQVAAEKDVSWAVLAALDYRENNNNPNSSMLSGEPVGVPNPDNPTTTSSKLDSAQQAADHFRAMASSVYGVTITAASGGEDVKLAFLAYNRGNIYRWAGVGPDASVYVMNNYGPGYVDMTWAAIAPGTGDPNNPGEPLRGRQEVGRYGAYTLFSRLGGSTAGGCGGLSGDDVVRVAQGELAAGIAEDNPGADCDCGAALKYQGTTGPEDWCADFVSWVYMTAGRPFDGGMDDGPTPIGVGWRLPGVSQLRGWMISHSTYEERANHDYSAAAPGDIVIFGAGTGSHTGIVERVSGLETPDPADDALVTIEGNSGDAVSRREYPVGSSYVQGWGAGPGADPDVVPVSTGGESGGGGPATGGELATVNADGVPSGWTESDNCGAGGTGGHWGTTDPNTRSIYYCGAAIDGDGGGEGRWNYVRQHERCHARAYEGLEAYHYTDERATEDCAERNGADLSFSPYV
jgi:hypothetical protein